MNTTTQTARRKQIEAELLGLTIGHAKVIAWESVVRWSEDVYEIGTWGKKQSTFAETADQLSGDGGHWENGKRKQVPAAKPCNVCDNDTIFSGTSTCALCGATGTQRSYAA